MLNSSLTAQEKRELYMKVYNENKAEIDSRIEDGIEKNRKGYCRIRVTDKDGKPVANKKVSIKQNKHDFKYGANIFMLDEFKNQRDNEEYRHFFKEYFNLATVPFYWDTLEPREGKPRYDKNSEKIYRRPAPDLCMDYCEQNGIDAKLHCLVYEHFIPEWMSKLPLSEVKKKYEERFRQISERYSGRMYEFEVINEVLCEWHDSALGYEKDIIEWSFNLAHKYFKNETLLINEGSHLTRAAKTGYSNPYLLLLERTFARGNKMSKIGIQNHQFTGTAAKTDEEYDKAIKNDVDMCNPLYYFKGLDMFSEFGLPLELTEVTIPTFGETPEDEELQADMLKLLYSIWFSYPNVDTIVYWNTVDGFAFDNGSGWNENNCHGGLFRHDLTPKKSAIMLKKLFGEVWRTNSELTTDSDGYVDFRGFFGDYTANLGNYNFEFGLHKNTKSSYEWSIK